MTRTCVDRDPGGTAALGTKTSQLQIRISPGQKALLKSLASEAGVSVSEYVLSRVLPAPRFDFESRAGALTGAARRDEALADLAEYLRGLPGEGFRQAVAGPGPPDLPPVLQNYVAGCVEREARLREADPPEWTRAVEPLSRAHFAWDLRSLRPYLMSVTPPDFKRRRIFAATPGKSAVDVSGVRSVTARSGGTDPTTLMLALDDALGEEGVISELCVVGGAVLRVVFTAAPDTRRPAAVFGHPDRADAAVRTVAEAHGLALDWVEPTVRELTRPATPPGHGRASDVVFERRCLRILPAPSDYVLAMRCAALSFAPEPGTDGDIRYLLRSLGLRTASDAMEVVDRYLNARQRPADLKERLADLLASRSLA